MSFSEVNLKKSRTDLTKTQKDNEVLSSCEDFSIAESENFLENVDQTILFFDGSIEDSTKQDEDASEDQPKTPGTLKNSFVISEDIHKVLNCLLKSLRDQIQLSIPNAFPWFFDEVFMISEDSSSDRPREIFNEIEKVCKAVKFPGKQTEKSSKSSKTISRMIPTPNEINEIGSVCIMAEPLDNGKILVFSTLQFFENHATISEDVLSVVNKDLQLVHEKIVARKIVGEKVHVIEIEFRGCFKKFSQK